MDGYKHHHLLKKDLGDDDWAMLIATLVVFYLL